MTGFFPYTGPDKQPVVITDDAGRDMMVSMTGEANVGFRVDDISITFQYGVSDMDIVNGGAVSGTGSVGADASMATTSSGLGVGSAALVSRDAVRYRSGHETFCMISTVFGAPEVGVNQYHGLLNADDAWAVGYQGLEFGLWFLEGGNTTFIPQSEFNADMLNGTGPSEYVIKPEFGQLYKLSYVWHGFLDLVLEVRTDSNTWVMAHRITYVNAQTEPHLKNPNLPITMKVERLSGSGVDVIIKSSSWRAGVISGIEENNTANRWFAAFVLNRVKSNSATNADHVMTLRSKDLFQGKTNHIKAEVKILVSTNATNKDLVFIATRLEALDAADQAAIEGDFSDINTANSVIEKSDVERLLTTVIPEDAIGDVAILQAGGQRDNTDVQGFTIYPNENVVFAVLGQATGTVSFQLNYRELH